MIGLDTSFLVAFEMDGHPKHTAAVAWASERASEGFGLAALVIAEFCHVVTDARRFRVPMSMAQAVEAARRWWRAEEVTVCGPDEEAVEEFLEAVAEHGLGRKRLLDTMLATAYRRAGIATIVTLDARDFAVLEGFAPIVI